MKRKPTHRNGIMLHRPSHNRFIASATTLLKQRLRWIVLAVALVGLAPVITVASAESFSVPANDSPELAWWRDSMETRDERLGWWREARFGMFVHWGVYSALGNEYKGRKGGGYAEHIQRVLKIPIPEYRAEVAGIFNPTNFSAFEWIRTAPN